MTIHCLPFAFILAVVVSIPTPAAARPPRGRPISGIVQKTNAPTREAEIMRTDTGMAVSFVWISRTLFVANMQVVDAAILEPGAKVEVIYRQPFFGRPFVTKVTLLSASERAVNKISMVFGVPGFEPRWTSTANIERLCPAAIIGVR